jgi:protein-histidine N-methyltransferase
MAQPFSFGFSGDDIEDDGSDVGTVNRGMGEDKSDGPPPVPAKSHGLDDMVGILCFASFSSFNLGGAFESQYWP